MINLERIDHVALSASDVERTAQWYLEVLGFKRRHEGLWNGVPVFVGKGDIAVAIFPAKSSGQESEKRSAPKLLHFAMRTDRKNFVAAQTDLTSRGIPFEFQDHGIAHSIYLGDPDQHEIEITTYEM